VITKFAGIILFRSTYTDQQIQYWQITNGCYPKLCCHRTVMPAEVPRTPPDPARGCAAPAAPAWPAGFAGPEQDSTA